MVFKYILWLVLANWLGSITIEAKQLPPLRFSFVGDIMAHDSNYKMRDFSRIYQYIKPLFEQTELNFANLEFVIDNKRPYSTYPVFNVHTEYVEAAIDAGFNIFSLANNHTADFGLTGVRATEQNSYRLKQQYPSLSFSGLRSEGKALDSFAMEAIEQKGWNIGFTAVSILSNSQKGIAGIQYLDSNDEDKLNVFYRWLAKQRPKYDLVVVSVHGGLEYQLQPSKNKQKIMRALARYGADIVWGHHPHVQQPWEIYQNFAQSNHQGNHQGNHQVQQPQRNWALIMYSQGNFISAQTIRTKPTKPQGFWAATGDSVLLQVEIAKIDSKLQLRSLQPQLLSTIRLKPFAFAVVPMANAAEQIAKQGYSGWANFYTQRQRWLKQRVALWPKGYHPSLFQPLAVPMQ